MLGVNHVHGAVHIADEDHFDEPSALTSPNRKVLAVPYFPWIAAQGMKRGGLNFAGRAAVRLGVIEVALVPTKIAGSHDKII
jgi:hypothetical protein